MNDNDPTVFSAALRERVRDEDPDLDQLIQVSTRTGTRLRRRRTVGVSLAGAAAGVAVIGIIGASLGGSAGTPDSEPGLASQPTAAPTPVSKPTEVAAPHQPRAQHLPVSVVPSLKGWKIGVAADEKFPASRGDYFLSVNVRPKSDYASWSGDDPDRPSSQVVHVGENYFVTVQPNPDVPSDVLDQLVAALRYQPRWAQ